jgi:uncharacterized protein (DUF885 family)
MRTTLLAGIACLALTACATVPAEEDSTAATSAAEAANWPDFVDAALEQYFANNPTFAIYVGDHRFDGQLPDLSEAALASHAEFLRSTIAQAEGFDGLSEDHAFERDYLVQVMKGDLFWLTDADWPHRNPAFYANAGLDPNVYVTRDYAPKAERMKAMIAFFKAVPGVADNIRANLRTPMPASYVKLGSDAFHGYAEYYKGDARTAFADVDDPAMQAEFMAASQAASEAMESLGNWIDTLKATATQDYALGADKFARMLKATEMVDMPLAQLKAIGEADLKRNRDAMKAACATYAPGRSIPECVDKMNADKPADGPVAEARRQIPELVAFVKANGIVTIPGTKMAGVEESPPYNRANSAYIDPPAPLEANASSIYYISPPDPAWPKEKQLGYIPGKDDLLFTSIHEVMPGHYLQFLHSNMAKSKVGKLFVGYAFAEGWAHYAEEMMYDAGVGKGAPEVHIGQLSNALLRNCRFLSAIGLHSGTMSEAQSKKMFMEQCYIDEGNAEQQAARGTYDPAYLNYTLGKLMIRKLREDWTATRGGRAAWGQFHDQFLSYGGPPVPLVRQRMMAEDAARAAF